MASTTRTPPQMALKIAFNGDIHRTRVDLRDFSLLDLTQLMAQTFRLSIVDFVVQYCDPEGDCINVATDADFHEAVRVFQGAQQSLKFSALTRRQVEFQEQVADPLLASVEQLLQALSLTREQLKRDRHFASSGAPLTSNILEQTGRDTAESPKTAASGFSSFAQGLVGHINRFIPEKKAGEATPALPVGTQAELVAPEHKMQVEEAPALPSVVCVEETLTPMPLAQETEETPSIASSTAFSDVEVQWAEQLSIVSGILPNVSPRRIIDVLEKSGGDLNVVLNVLTEEN